MSQSSANSKFLGAFFPAKRSAAIFVGYIVFFSAQSILVKASQTDRSYDYSVTCVVMLTEVVKLILSSALYLKDHSFRTLTSEIFKYRQVLMFYFVPALLYCFYNNLAFRNLEHFDPTTYNLLMQFRVVITGIFFQLLFKRHLSGQQWLSLCLLTLGCIIKQFSVMGVSSRATDSGILETLFSFEILFLLFQILCSSLAGVYTEFLLKDTGADLHIMIHNLFMYADSIVCNLIVLLWHGQTSELMNTATLRNIFVQPTVVLIIANGALCGIIVSMFLRNLNSILKTFAGALDLSFMVVLCWLIFGIPIDMLTIMAITVVSIATYLYSREPVVNKIEEKKAGTSDSRLTEEPFALASVVTTPAAS